MELKGQKKYKNLKTLEHLQGTVGLGKQLKIYTNRFVMLKLLPKKKYRISLRVFPNIMVE